MQVNGLLSYRQACQCDCGHRFCFNCEDDSHDPLPCDMIAKWKVHDYKTAFYLSTDTKQCPNCTVYIDKDGGGCCMVKRFFIYRNLLSILLQFHCVQFNYSNAHCVTINFVGCATVLGTIRHRTIIAWPMVMQKMEKGENTLENWFISLIIYNNLLAHIYIFSSHRDLISYMTNEISLECEKNLFDSTTIKGRIEQLQGGGVSDNDVS